MKKILLSPAGQTVLVESINRDATDAHGNPAPTYSPPVTVTVYGVAPRLAAEGTADGQDYTTEATWDIYAPLGTPITAFDRLTLPTGEITEVTAPPKVWDNAPLLDFLSVGGVHIVATELK